MNNTRLFMLTGAGLATLLSGCATAPIEQAALARSAVDDAVNAGANEFAAADLASAQGKIHGMDAALEQRQFDIARRLAEQAELDARLAETKARSAKAEMAASELQESISILRRETQSK
jgi:hypothetical protein